jgi:hypothetical protein
VRIEAFVFAEIHGKRLPLLDSAAVLAGAAYLLRSVKTREKRCPTRARKEGGLLRNAVI